MQLDFNMPVVADDGLDAGALDRVLVDRSRCAVTHIVLRTPFASEEVLLSLDLVQGTQGGRLRVRPGRDELYILPRYYEGRKSDLPAGRVDTSLVPQPPERRQDLDRALGISEDTVELGPETRVMTTDEVEALLVGLGSNEPGNDVSRLRVRGPGGAETDVPASWIDVMREDVVALRVPSEDILRARPSPRLRGKKLTDLESLSGAGGMGGETPEEAFGPDFVDETSAKEDHEGSGARGGRT